MEKNQVISIEEIEKYVADNIMPSRGIHIAPDWDLDKNWKLCQDHYGTEFNFQLFNINRDNEHVYLPPMGLYKRIVIEYVNDRPLGRFNFFKAQWLINDYVLTGWRYPVQAVWNWKMKWWEIHPGFIRGVVYQLFNVREFTAWYQPMTNDKHVDYIHKFTDPNVLLDTMQFRDNHHIDAELVRYFDRPLLKLCIHVSHDKESSSDFEKLFYNNVRNGFNINCPIEVEHSIKKELQSWPQHKLKDIFVFNTPIIGPTLNITEYDMIKFYVGIYFGGTNIKRFTDLGLDYFNNQP